MDIKSAKYVSFLGNDKSQIEAVIDDVTMNVPLDPANRHYAEIMRQVKEEGLTIKDADE